MHHILTTNEDTSTDRRYMHANYCPFERGVANIGVTVLFATRDQGLYKEMPEDSLRRM